MRALLFVCAVACLFAFGRAGRGEPPARVRYRLSYAVPDNATVHVRIEMRGNAAAARTLLIPRAVPMGYSEEPY